MAVKKNIWYKNLMENLVEVQNVSKTFSSKGGFLNPHTEPVWALKGVSLNIKKGEILGLVGESGSGKSTLGNCILRLLNFEDGKIFYNGKNISNFSKNEVKNFRKNTSLIFQNPYSSLNPKMKVREILSEPLFVHGIRAKNEVEEALNEIINLTGLSPDDLARYPHEFSGGQRQRIAIARALILRPEFVVADEPISALDVSIQAQIINLLLDLKEKFNLTYLFISHDLNVVKYLCTRVVILYRGEIVETGRTEDVFMCPKHEYTRLLLKSIPNIY